MRTASRRPPAALAAIGILLALMGLGLLVYNAWEAGQSEPTASAVKGEQAPH